MRRLLLVLCMCALASLACSADDVIGQRQSVPTPTPPAFATATPGGRISVSLNTAAAPFVVNPATTAQGVLVAPAASATAAYLARAAATATALAPVAVPLFQSSECPPIAAPIAPLRPTTFNSYAQTIGLFLSAGGATTTLESTLRAWGAINEGRGVVQADTDLTGDGVNEVILALSDPATFRAEQPSPGQMLIFGCDKRSYKLLYSTPFSQATLLPELKRVGNMNGNGRAQIVFTQALCNAGVACTSALQILAWNSTIGVFAALNENGIDTTNAKVQIADVDNDGLLEISVTTQPGNDLNAGPFRRVMSIYDWNGANYTLALTQIDAPVYRIHALYDADALFMAGDFRAASRAYDKVRDDPNYALWTASDPVLLRAFAGYRKLLIFGGSRQAKALEDAANALNAEFPPGSGGELWAQAGSALLDAYKQNRSSIKKACAAMQGFFAGRSDVVNSINIYGTTNHMYTPPELCPF